MLLLSQDLGEKMYPWPLTRFIEGEGYYFKDIFIDFILKKENINFKYWELDARTKETKKAYQVLKKKFRQYFNKLYFKLVQCTDGFYLTEWGELCGIYYKPNHKKHFYELQVFYENELLYTFDKYNSTYWKYNWDIVHWHLTRPMTMNIVKTYFEIIEKGLNCYM